LGEARLGEEADFQAGGAGVDGEDRGFGHVCHRGELRSGGVRFGRLACAGVYRRMIVVMDA
jgi:hypothetical protein